MENVSRFRLMDKVKTHTSTNRWREGVVIGISGNAQFKINNDGYGYPEVTYYYNLASLNMNTMIEDVPENNLRPI